jgi:hypothetical protein
MRRLWLVGLATILACVAVLGLLRAIREHPAHWARVMPKVALSESPQIDLEKALQAVGDQDGPKSGTKVPLAEFVQGNGRRINVVLIEGQFFNTVIEPRGVWRNLGSSMLLVSSVDENRSSKGDLSGRLPLAAALRMRRSGKDWAEPPSPNVGDHIGTADISRGWGDYRRS